MSELCLNYTLKEIENMTNILYHLFRAHNDKTYAIHGWGEKILGYGIKQTSFENFKLKQHPINERKFRMHRQTLLDNRFIEIFGKSKRVKGGPYYSITPLGLFYMMSKMDGYGKNIMTDIFKILDFHTPKKLVWDYFESKLWNDFTIKEIDKAVKQLTTNSEFIFKSDETLFSLDILLLNSNNKLRVFQARLNLKQIQMEKLGSMDLKKSKFKDHSKGFYFGISNYISMLLCYYLFQNIKNQKRFRKMHPSFQNKVDWIWSIIEMELKKDLEKINSDVIESYGINSNSEFGKEIVNELVKRD